MMRWILASKFISALSIIVQVTIFGFVIEPSSVQDAYSALALISLVSQVAVAIPTLISTQSTWLEPEQQSKQFTKAILLASTLLIIGGISAALSNNALGGLSGFILIAFIPVLASIANVFAASHFASGNLNIGAQYNILNVVLPQAAAGVGALITKDITFWFMGLALGHSISLLVITAHWKIKSNEFYFGLKGKRDPLKISTNIILTTFVFFIFSWSVLNTPRIFLGESQKSVESAQLLLAATIGFAISNAIETLIIQVRRSQWLSFLETKSSIKFTKNLDREKIAIFSIFAAAAVPGSICAYVFIYIMDKDANALVGFFAVFCLLTVECCRGAISTIYAVCECERKQQKLLPLFMLFIAIYVFVFFRYALVSPSLSYEIAAAVMLICALILLIKATNFTNVFKFRI